MKAWCTPRRLSYLFTIALISSTTLSAEVSFARGTTRNFRTSFVDKDATLRKRTTTSRNSPSLSFLTRTCRGGAFHLDEDEYDNEYDNEEEEDETGVQSSDDATPTALSSVVDTLNSISQAIMRALGAASKSLQSEDDKKEVSFVGKVFQTIKSMISAALNPDYDNNPDYQEAEEDEDDSSADDTPMEVKSKPLPRPVDLGSYLAQSYGAPDGRKDATESPILGGSLADALRIARSSAKLVVVMIPSTAPNKSRTKIDRQAITSFLSAQVAKVAKKKARKKGETTSYLLWSAKAGSSEAAMAMKRLKVKATSSKGDKRPILLVAYPVQKIGPGGIPKVAPKVLAQHHCSPPPSSEAMAQWMNELRKRHSKQYAIMQKEIREIELFKERKEGYKESVQSDNERKIREKKEEEERLAKEKVEQERLEALEKRRTEFLEALPEEPDAKERGAITLSVRHPDGKTEKRRFAKDTQLSVVFNWIDGSFKMERELVVLTTMNGKQTFSWEDAEEKKTLVEAKLGRMVGFRLSEKKVEDTKEEDKEEGDEENMSALNHF